MSEEDKKIPVEYAGISILSSSTNKKYPLAIGFHDEKQELIGYVPMTLALLDDFGQKLSDQYNNLLLAKKMSEIKKLPRIILPH